MEIINNFSLPFASLTAILNPNSSLESRIASISDQLTEQNKSDMQQSLSLLGSWFWPTRTVRNLMAQLPADLIGQFIQATLRTEDFEKSEKILSNFLNILPDDTLLKLADFTDQDAAKNWYQSRILLKNNAIKNPFLKEGEAIGKEFLYEFKYFIFHFFDILVALTGLNRIEFNHVNGRMDVWEAKHKLMMYAKMLNFPSFVFAPMSVYIAFAPLAAGLTALSILSLLVTVVAYERYFKPCPKEFYGLTNLTLERLKSNEPIYARQDILGQIQDSFAEGKSVMLVGEPGSGKSALPKALAEEIAKKRICTFIKNPQIFSGAASQFKSLHDLSFLTLYQTFKKHSNQVIFFFDEFHSIFKTDGLIGSNTGEEVKTFYETFKYTIGATTTKEYNEYIKDHPAIVDRRYNIIEVPALKDEKIKIILNQFLESLYPTIRQAEGVLNYIIHQAENFKRNTSKVDASLSLLNRAINKINMCQFKELKTQINDLEDEEKLLKQDLFNLHQNESDKAQMLTDKITEVRNKISELTAVLTKKNKQLTIVKKFEELLAKLKFQCLEITQPKNEEPDMAFLQLCAKINLIEHFLDEKKENLKLSSKLDISLIDAILSEENGDMT
jgi:ABC-type dipeptide/oligopeptide/nickel transport system ATPase component